MKLTMIREKAEREREAKEAHSREIMRNYYRVMVSELPSSK